MEITCKNNFSELSTQELEEIKGGFRWLRRYGIMGYIITEIVDGIQDGLKADCSEVDCCI